jgi:hypothetical protein
LDVLIARLSDVINASAISKRERNQEPSYLLGKLCFYGQPGEVRANVGRREDEDELEMFGHGKWYWRVPSPMA